MKRYHFFRQQNHRLFYKYKKEDEIDCFEINRKLFDAADFHRRKLSFQEENVLPISYGLHCCQEHS